MQRLAAPCSPRPSIRASFRNRPHPPFYPLTPTRRYPLPLYPLQVPQHETNWVACDACGKWRKLPPGVRLEGEQAAGRWLCKHNVWDRKRQSCKAAEEPWA